MSPNHPPSASEAFLSTNGTHNSATGTVGAIVSLNEDIDAPVRRKLPQVIDLTQLTPKKVPSLWQPYVPAKFCLLDGKPDVGKSQLYLYLTACLTRGEPFFTEDTDLTREPGNVIIVQAEDDIEDTFLPRLHAAGADLSRVILLQSTWTTPPARGKTTKGKITFNDLEALHIAAKQYASKLIVLDPFNAFVAGKGTNTSHSMRPLMENLMHLATMHACPVLVVRHISKHHRGTALDAGAGSHDIVAACRSLLLAARDPSVPGQFVLAHAKSNLATKGDTLTYRLVNDPNWDAPCLAFTGYSHLTADDLASPKRVDQGIETAEAFLQEFLSAKPRPAEDVKKAAQRCGFSRRALEAAKKNVGIQTKGVYTQGRRGAQEHLWFLPTVPPEG